MEGVLCPIIVGRETELVALTELLGAAAAGHGRLASLLGDAGVGKSRLVRELAASSPVDRSPRRRRPP
ncbi:MAG TPA: AAA family ATPase [Pseudonocardiaceae bacterium]